MGKEGGERAPWKKWTARITGIAGTLSALVVLTVQTCSEVRSARLQASQVEDKAQAGYETMAEAVKELQTIATDVEEWTDDTDDVIKDLRDEVLKLRLQLSKHEAYFDVLKDSRDHRRRLGTVRYEDYAVEAPPLPTAAAKKPARPKAKVPDTLDMAQQVAH
jgi:hypothetical protein